MGCCKCLLLVLFILHFAGLVWPDSFKEDDDVSPPSSSSENVVKTNIGNAATTTTTTKSNLEPAKLIVVNLQSSPTTLRNTTPPRVLVLNATTPLSVTMDSSTRKRSMDNITMPTVVPVMPLMPTLPLEGLFVMNDQNVTCIVLKAGVRFTFNYYNVSSNTMVNGSRIDLPTRNYTVDGICTPERQRLSVVFYPHPDLKWNLTFVFVQNGSTHMHAEWISLQYSFRTGALPFPWASGVDTEAVYNQSSMFRMPMESSFLCMANSGVQNFSKSSEEAHLFQMQLFGLQIEAFRKLNTTALSTTIVQCEADFVSSTVPIIVGVVLLILIIAVLIVFFIQRRMLKNHNYDPVKQ